MPPEPELFEAGGRVYIDGLPQLKKALRDLGGAELQRELGKVHKSIGEMVIARLGGAQTGVGTGAGSTIRPSAATREVLLRVGGRHRREPLPSGRRLPIRIRQWGKSSIFPPPYRPFLVQAARDIMPDIEREYLTGVSRIWTDAWQGAPRD